MAFGVNLLPGVGAGALSRPAPHSSANSNLAAYGRQGARFEFSARVDCFSGHACAGPNAGEVFRQFDSFIEAACLDKISARDRYQEEYSLLAAAGLIFDESSAPGLSAAFAALLSGSPGTASENQDAGADLVNRMNAFTFATRSAAELMAELEHRASGMICEGIAKVNDLSAQITGINKELNTGGVRGRNSVNALTDRRADLTRQLAGITDIRLKGGQPVEYTLSTSSGFPLVRGEDAFFLEYRETGIEAGAAPAGFTGARESNGGFSPEGKIEFRGGSLAGCLEFRDRKLAGYRLGLADLTAAVIREVESAGNSAARIAALAAKEVAIGEGDRCVTSTLNDFYTGLTAAISADASSCKYMADVEKAMADELDARRGEISGVNLDDDMGNLIKSQSAYKAAAKLVTTADQMLQALFALKL